jgi:hypothetical protein
LREQRFEAAIARGERSIAIAGGVSHSIVTTGDVVLEVRDDGLGSELRRLLRSERPRKASRRPLRPPPVFADRIDREREIADVAAGVLRGSVNVYGPPGVGKTYIIRDAANRILPKRFRDGSVFLPRKIERIEDGLQALFEEFFTCDPPARPSDAEIRRDLDRKRAVVFLDAVSVDREEIQAFVASAPRSVFVIASRARVLWEGGPVFVEGLSAGDGERVIETELGRPLEPQEREPAAAICAAVGGNPLRLRQASALVRETSRTLAEIARAVSAKPERALLEAALDSLTSEQRRLVLSLAVFDGASVGAEHLAAITGTPEVVRALEPLQRLHLADSGSPRYNATAAITDATWLDVESDAAHALRYFAGWAEREGPGLDRVVEEGDALMQMLRWAQALGQFKEGIVLARACASVLAASRRFGAWGDVVRGTLGWAESINDLETLGWALHEEGTRLFCIGRATESAAMLGQAAHVREQMGQSQAAARSRANLDVVRRPRSLFARFAHVSFLAMTLALIALFLAGGVAAWKLTGRTPSSAPAVTPGQSNSQACSTCGESDGSCSTCGGKEQTVETLSLVVSPTSPTVGTLQVGTTTCPPTCTAIFDPGETATIHASSVAPGWFLSSWTHSCRETSNDVENCVVEMTENKTAGATFTETTSQKAPSVTVTNG